MQGSEADLAYIQDMIDAAEAVLRHVAGKSRQDFDHSELLRELLNGAWKYSARPLDECQKKLETRILKSHGTRSGRRGIFWRTTMAT